MTVVCGIDVGHDAVRVAALVDDRPVSIAALPAWVGFDGEAVVVGAAARARPADQRMQPRAARGDAVRPPAELLAWLVRAAVAAVEAEHGGVAGAVIAVPAGAGAVERRALREAAALAGVPAVRLCAEPVLAALALPTPADARWLVCDAGATGFTASVVELVGGAIDRLATVTEPDLGGDALDRLIAAELGKELGGVRTGDPDWPDLCAAARAVKEHAAAAAAAEAAFHAALAGASDAARRLRPPRRDEIELWSAPRVRRVEDVCHRALTAAGGTLSELGEVVLVGGGARLATMVRRLTQACGRAPRLPADAGFAVAHGAALAARMYVAEPAALMIDVVPHAIALAAGDAPVALVAAGAVAPTRAARVIPTRHADQDAIEVELWEETSPRRLLGRYRVGGLPPAPAGDALALCSVTIDVDGVPRLAATELVSGAPLTVAPLAEAGLDAATIAAQRPVVAAWRP